MVWYPFNRVLKSKMTSVSGLVVPFRVLSRKFLEEVNVSQLIWYGPRPQNRILVPFSALRRGFFLASLLACTKSFRSDYAKY